MKLGELLLKHSLIDQAQLEEALQAQVIFGGKLGTILIEMGLITEKTLATALSKQLGFPCAQPGQLEKIPESVIAIISRELAEKHQAVPVSVSGRKLTLAMANPQDLKAVDEIAFRTGYIIIPILALEVRLVLALERYYGLKRAMRYVPPPSKRINRPAPATAKTAAGADKPVEAQTLLEEAGYFGADDEMPATPARKPVEVAPPAQAPAAEPIEELEAVEIVEELTDEEVTLATTATALVAARDRNHVADALIRYLGAHYARAALFMVVGGVATGWRSAKNGKPIAGFDEVQIPLNEPSVLKTAVDTQSYVLGPIPTSGANLALTTMLGKPAPRTAILLPLTMLGRVVGLIYVDDPEQEMAEQLAVLQQLATKALMTFEILILHNKILRV
ncbi:MAG: hypothetical protein RQ723_03535 [Desulfuromonadales bacterium]|nr:hypothetical protein [Desulfuromonadales bacterium]